MIIKQKRFWIGILFLVPLFIFVVGKGLNFGTAVLFDRLKKIEEKTESVTKGVVITAPTLKRQEKEYQEHSVLTTNGVVQFTNEHRVKNGLKPLIENSKLKSSALKKAQDMFEKQYFEHDSPSGLGAGDLAKDAGYKFIVIGENLAVGNFADDGALLKGWMDSPGHRANILNPRFQEIGVSVLRGTYQGKSTWMAVQHFGLNVSSCPSVDNLLKANIDKNFNDLTAMEEDLKTKKETLENTPPSDASYNQKTDEYNAKVNEYNLLLEVTQKIVDEYNTQVSKFNICAQG